MNAGNQLRALLLADGAVTALVADRVSSDRVEQNSARPFIVYTQIGGEPQYGLGSDVLGERAVLELQIWGDRRTSVDAVRDAVVAALTADERHVISTSSGYDADLDLEASLLTVEWWDD